MMIGTFYYDSYGAIGVVCQEDTMYGNAVRCLELAGQIRGKNSHILEITASRKESRTQLIDYLRGAITTKTANDFPKEKFFIQSRYLHDTKDYMPAIQYFHFHRSEKISSLKQLHECFKKIPYLTQQHKKATIEIFLALHPEFELAHVPTLHL